tara:strand:- start:486 stop:1106 length:621 start_codon:yes stop_codon:yes gene_type:complete
MVKFWLNNPYELLNKQNISHLIPQNKDTLEEKLNAMTRLILLLTILGYIITKSIKIVLSGIVSLVLIAILYKSKEKNHVEGFNASKIKKDKTKLNKSKYTMPTKKNPLMNVLLPEIQDDPTREKAAPAYNNNIEKLIDEKAIDPNIFRDLGDTMAFSNSMRQFYATANTQVPNDQKAFLDFCYKNMPSCKDQSYLTCTARSSKYTN